MVSSDSRWPRSIASRVFLSTSLIRVSAFHRVFQCLEKVRIEVVWHATLSLNLRGKGHGASAKDPDRNQVINSSHRALESSKSREGPQSVRSEPLGTLTAKEEGGSGLAPCC